MIKLPKFTNPLYLNKRFINYNIHKLDYGHFTEDIYSLPKSNLENLLIQTPSISEQVTIVKLYQNIRSQQNLLEHRVEMVSNIFEGSLINILNQERQEL